jgi:hypothetical protein
MFAVGRNYSDTSLLKTQSLFVTKPRENDCLTELLCSGTLQEANEQLPVLIVGILLKRLVQNGDGHESGPTVRSASLVEQRRLETPVSSD